MSNYPDSMTSDAYRTHLCEAASVDYSDIDAACDEAEAALAPYTLDEVATTEDDAAREIGFRMCKEIVDAIPEDFERDDYRTELKTTHPKLHALLEAL